MSEGADNTIKNLKSWIEVTKRTLEKIKMRISDLTLERENFQNKWLHHPERERIIIENTAEINYAKELIEIGEKRLKELKDHLKENKEGKLW